MKTQHGFVAFLFVGLFALGSAVHAELIVYDGFGYPTGYLEISDGGDNAGDPTTDTGVYDNLDDGFSNLFDETDPNNADPSTGVQPTVLGNPGRNGGDGPWVTSWTKRNRADNNANQVDSTQTLSYTDSQGKSLVTTMGQGVFSARSNNTWRTFDASTLGSNPTFANDNGDYNVPVLGKQGTTVWMSFLGDRSHGPDAQLEGNWFMAMQFWHKQGKMAGGDPFANRTGGIFRDNSADDNSTDWLIWDAPFTTDPSGPIGLPAGGFIPGSRAADEDDSNGDLFLVVKLDYSAVHPTDSSITDGWADVSIFVDPDLGSTEPTNPALTGSVYYAFNGINLSSTGFPNAKSTSSIDEIRLGTEYADVAPIASAGLAGDYDNDGFVGQSDLDLVLLNWGDTSPPAPAGWVNEVPNGLIGQGALDGVLLNWGDSATGLTAVPEPSSALLLLLAVAAGFLSRKF